MTIVLKILGALGMLWSVAVIALIVYYSKEYAEGLPWLAIGFYAVVFFIWWRCYCLRRLGAVLAAAYSAWMLVIGLELGLWQWNVIWGGTALILFTVTSLTWEQLKSGV